MRPDLVGMPVVESATVPLTRLDEDGKEVPLLCMVLEGTIYVHPKRMIHFEALRSKNR